MTILDTLIAKVIISAALCILFLYWALVCYDKATEIGTWHTGNQLANWMGFALFCVLSIAEGVILGGFLLGHAWY